MEEKQKTPFLRAISGFSAYFQSGEPYTVLIIVEPIFFVAISIPVTG